MRDIFQAFCVDGALKTIAPYGNGHINRTYLAVTDKDTPYILQKINDAVFHDVESLMRNISLVTAHLKKKNSDPRRVLTLVKTRSGAPWLKTAAGEYYRVYEFVWGSVCLERVERAEDFYFSALGFGEFQRQLSDFDASSLTEILPAFHDTPARYLQLHEAMAVNYGNRLLQVERELAFYLAREEEAGALMALMRAGTLPLRVTHNDTKLNNVLLDEKTHEPLCVIDLDTVMPGLVANDFGDSIRFGASTAAEDEVDLARVHISLPLFERYACGFLRACGETLTPAEVETLPLGAKLMTLECGVRFLADYLRGDAYFMVHRPEHNRLRCLTQMQLVKDMEENWGAMEDAFVRAAAAARTTRWRF